MSAFDIRMAAIASAALIVAESEYMDPAGKTEELAARFLEFMHTGETKAERDAKAQAEAAPEPEVEQTYAKGWDAGIEYAATEALAALGWEHRAALPEDLRAAVDRYEARKYGDPVPPSPGKP